MEQSKKMGLIGGSLGCILGGLLWIMILGISIKSYCITVVPVILAAFCILFVINFSRAYPERSTSIMGLVVLLVGSANMVFLNYYYDVIPSQIGGITTGKDSIPLPILNIAIAALLISGVFMVGKGGSKK